MGPHSFAQAGGLGLGRSREVPSACAEQIFGKKSIMRKPGLCD